MSLPAIVSAGSGLLEWTPRLETAGAVLALADPRGQVRMFHFAAGEAPALSLVGADGLPLADGTYTWELRLTPRPGLGRPPAPLVQSGHFAIAEGSLVDPDLTEPIAGRRPPAGSPDLAHTTAADQIVPDDFIVDGKGCIGLGCVNNETFGAEALRLKQSVVRLRFEDTSTAGGFPTRDWQLTANDPGSGGADRFAIEDLTAGTTPLSIRGGAPTNALYVDPQGNLGLGTATPAAQLHVSSSSSGGKALFENTNPTAAPREMFEVRNKGGAAVIFDDTDDPARWANTAFGPNFLFNNQANPGVEYTFGPTGNLTISGNLTAANFPSSSRALKERFVALSPAAILAKVVKMPVSEWSFKDDPEHRRHIGPTVEDFQAAFGLGTSGQSLVVTDVNGVALAAIQGLYGELQEQKRVVEVQRVIIEELRRQIEQLASERPE
jgi:hypothetical protein